MDTTPQTHYTLEDIAGLASIVMLPELEALIGRLEIKPVSVYSHADVRRIIRATQKEN